MQLQVNTVFLMPMSNVVKYKMAEISEGEDIILQSFQHNFLQKAFVRLCIRALIATGSSLSYSIYSDFSGS